LLQPTKLWQKEVGDMNFNKIKEIREQANDLPSQSYTAMILIRELCDAMLDVQNCWHHPATEAKGHLISECKLRGCK
jgi:hypothetical protein